MDVHDIFVTGGGISLVVMVYQTAINSRIKSSVEAEYKAKHAVLESKLEAELKTQILEQTHRYELAATEHQLRYEKLIERRADVIAEIYSQLSTTYDKMTEFLEQDSSNKTVERWIELSDIVSDQLEKFQLSFSTKRIYLPKSVIDLLLQIRGQIHNITMARLTQATWHLNPLTHQIDGRTEHDDLAKLYSDVVKNILPVFCALEDEMRKLMGVER